MYLNMVQRKRRSTDFLTDGLFLTSQAHSESTGAEYSLWVSHCSAALLRQPPDDNGFWPLMTTVRFEPVTLR